MKKMAFQPGFWPSLLTLMGIAVLLALGTWQVQRLDWKAEVLALLETRMSQPPEALPLKIAAPEEWDYRRVSVEGRFLHDHAFYLQPRQYGQRNGVHLLTPFERRSGDIILVNRGFLPENMYEYERPQGHVTLSGMAHIPDDQNIFTPLNQVGDDHIYWSDLDFISAEAGLDLAVPLVLYVDDKRDGVYPVGGQIRLDIPNNHLQYAVFWYMMGFVLAVIFILHGLRSGKSTT